MPAKKKPGDSFRLPHRRHEYFNFFVPQPLGVVPMCESGRNILAKHKKNSLKINRSLLRRIMKKFGMKAMKNHGTLNGILNVTLNVTLKNDNLTDNELTLLSILLSNPSISLFDASDRMGIFRRTVSRIVASLQDKGIVDRKESKKEGSWRIVK